MGIRKVIVKQTAAEAIAAIAWFIELFLRRVSQASSTKDLYRAVGEEI